MQVVETVEAQSRGVRCQLAAGRRGGGRGSADAHSELQCRHDIIAQLAHSLLAERTRRYPDAEGDVVDTVRQVGDNHRRQATRVALCAPREVGWSRGWSHPRSTSDGWTRGNAVVAAAHLAAGWAGTPSGVGSGRVEWRTDSTSDTAPVVVRLPRPASLNRVPHLAHLPGEQKFHRLTVV